MQQADAVFAGSVPQLYERYMVPMLFEPYAEDLLERLEERSPSRILEIAAGTGAVTRAMAAGFPAGVSIVATDLNPGMLEHARLLGTARPVEWLVADAMALPFPDASFDAVVCQFGSMFFPDKAKAFAEIHRVLAPGGGFLFSVWNAIEESEFADVVMRALARVFPNDPPRFMQRTPHGYRDPAVIARDLAAAGFGAAPHVAVVAKQSHARTAADVALGFCQGTPVRGEIDARDPARLAEATELATQAVTERFGPGPVVGRMQALVVSVER
ncbi:MAG TPA: class I SAM-dependent methyltransferase [Polyangiaceae bacterium]|nr:class I SAM-dependent methyltransferase [Polyangiaceae bacterium]